jgi:CO dehydrogenase nickel-insertion accessory protein CooC1
VFGKHPLSLFFVVFISKEIEFFAKRGLQKYKIIIIIIEMSFSVLHTAKYLKNIKIIFLLKI